jgi:hypothetical protein
MRSARYVLAAVTACLLLPTAVAHGEPSPTRAKAKATVEFLLPLLLGDDARHPRVSDCRRSRLDPDTWLCRLSWATHPDRWTTRSCHGVVRNEPEWVRMRDQTTRCHEHRTATRGRGLPAWSGGQDFDGKPPVFDAHRTGAGYAELHADVVGTGGQSDDRHGA